MSRNNDDSTEELPRLLLDPVSGEVVLEFRQFEGNLISTLDRRVIFGVVEGDVPSTGETPHVLLQVGVLRLPNGLLPTVHQYTELRDLLWPVTKENVY